MLEIQMMRTWLTAGLHAVRRHSARRHPSRPPLDAGTSAPDAGASIVETVVIIGLFVAAAIIIVGILVSKATDAANNVKTQ